MAYKMRRYQCPDCEDEFDYLHSVVAGVEEPPPLYCPKCGAYVGQDAPPLPATFKTAGLAGKSGDMVYRAMEDSSEYRMQLAAKESGMDYNDFKNMKLTDMKDNMREGDFSYKAPPANEVTKTMAQTQGTTGYNISAENQRFIADAQKGPYVGAGNASRANVTALHQRTAAQTVAAGRINK